MRRSIRATATGARPRQIRPRLGSNRSQARRRRRTTRVLLTVIASCVLLSISVVGVVTSLSRLNPEPPTTQRCSAQLEGTNWFLSPDQAQNAALFAAMAAERGLPARAVTIAIATALQESRMINIDYGDRDSIGLFQQRPSQGWGTVEQIMGPVYSTGKFYDGLVRVPDYQGLEITVAAQAVQRSGFPDAYAQHEGRARAWASALTGHSPGAITCSLTDPARAPDTEDPTGKLTARIVRDFPSLAPVSEKTVSEKAGSGSAAAVRVDVSPLLRSDDGEDRRARLATALAHWAVAVAHEQDIVSVEFEDLVWSRASNTWDTPADPGRTDGADASQELPGAGIVVIRLAQP